MRLNNKAFTYTPEEVAEQVQYWQEHLPGSFTEPQEPLTEVQERLLGTLINFLQVVEAEEEVKDSDSFDFCIRGMWNTAKAGCTIRIAENFADRFSYIKLDAVERMVSDATRIGSSGLDALLEYDTSTTSSPQARQENGEHQNKPNQDDEPPDLPYC